MYLIDTAVIEDDSKARKDLEDCLLRYQKEQEGISFVLHDFSDGEAFLESLKQRNYSLVLMDIELGEGKANGMEIAKKFRTLDDSTVLVFVTNMRQYVVEGYEVNALNYILKPVKYYSLALTLDKGIRALSYDLNDGIMIKTKGNMVKLNRKNILYVDVVQHSVVFHTLEGDYETYGSLKSAESDLLSHGFFKVNSFTLVNLKFVQKLEGNEIRMADNKKIFLARRRKKDFINALISCFGEVL